MKYKSFIADIIALVFYLGTATCRDEYTQDGFYFKTASDLTQVPRDIPGEARKVDISSNAITELEANTFSNLSVCSYLRLSFNKISVINRGAFSGLESLGELHLDANSMTDIKVDTFAGVESLYRLELGDNDISSIEAGAFGMISGLRELKLYGNDLTSIRGRHVAGYRPTFRIEFRQ